MYITIRQHAKEHQLSWEDLIKGMEKTVSWNQVSDCSGTITRIIYTATPELKQKANVAYLIKQLNSFCEKHENLYKVPRHTLYRSFQIPKKSGGFRTINAPNDMLSAALYELKSILEIDAGALYHTAAFAYVKGRSTQDAVRKHQKNESNWFLKLDFSDFFGSISLDFLMKMISMIFPFSLIVEDIDGKSALRKALSLCFLNGGLPQGTPISPMLTNLCMIPIDHRIFNNLADRRFVYTRYADDLLISCVQAFDWRKMQKEIENILGSFQAPLKIKTEKTRYGSRKGSNWNLGLMLNKENKVTVGHMKKKFFKASVCSFILDEQNHKPWPMEDVQHLVGIISYYKSVEPEYFEYVIDHNNQKFHTNFEALLKQRLAYG